MTEAERRAALFPSLMAALEHMRIEFCGNGQSQGRAKDAALAEATAVLAEARNTQRKEVA